MKLGLNRNQQGASMFKVVHEWFHKNVLKLVVIFIFHVGGPIHTAVHGRGK